MKKRGLFKAASALVMAAMLTVGVSSTAFARVPLSVTLDVKAPDGSAVATEVIDGKTVYLVPHDSTYTITETNGLCLGQIYKIVSEDDSMIGRTDLADCNVNTEYNIDNELSAYGYYDSRNLPEYSYLALDLYDQDATITEGTVMYYFKFIDGSSTSAVTSSWASDANGWWIQNSDGSYLTNAWYQDADGKWYYMGADGYMLTNTTTPDGYVVNEAGVLIQ